MSRRGGSRCRDRHRFPGVDARKAPSRGFMAQYQRFGEIAMGLGLIDPAALAEALTEQAERRTRGEKVLLGQILLERGVLDEQGIKRVLDALYPVRERELAE